MKNIKKLLILVLALVMCLSAVSINTFAAAFDTEVYVYTRYFDDTNKLYVSVVSEKACGAMKATLSYPSAKLTFVPENSKLVEDSNIEGKYNNNDVTGEITFAVVTKDTSVGDKYWADLCFTVVENEGITLTLKDIEVCDIGENLDDAVPVSSKTVNADAVINGIGAQFRPKDTEKDAAIRFGTKLNRTTSGEGSGLRSEIIVDGNTYYAVQVGHIFAFSDDLTGDVKLNASVDSKTGALSYTSYDKKVRHNKSKVNYKTATEYIIYTLAIKFVDDDNLTALQKQAKNITVRPYVIYKNTEGEPNYTIRFGEDLENSYNNVESIYNFVTN